MKSTHSMYPCLLKVAVAVSIATGSFGAAAAGAIPEFQGASTPQTILNTDRLIVKYKDANVGSAQARVATAMTSARQAIADRAGQQLGLRMQALRSTATGAHVFKIDRKVSLKDAEALAQELMARDPSIEYAEPDRIMRKMATANDPMYAQQWHYTETTGGLRLPAAWDLSTGTGVKVAVIDTGIRPHADLSGQYVGGYDFISDATIGNDGNARDADPSDPGDWTAANECAAGEPASGSSWHGTHVAGTIAAKTNNSLGVAGVAYNAKVVPVRVLGKCGGYTSDIADAIIWASGGTVSGVPANANAAKVINMSLGGGGACGTTTQNAINSARSRGTVVIVAAGNENMNASNSNPANCSGVVTVAATNRNGARAPYSNYGTVVDVAAPGGDANGYIISTLNAGTSAPGADNYAGYQGTSMATPHVAGVAALMLARNSALTPDQIESKLKSTARAFPGTCSQCGTGIVDAAAAVASATTSTPVGPTIAETESNNTIATANAISTTGTTVNGTMSASTDSDYFVVQLPAGKTLQASMTPGLSTADYDVYIYNSAGTQLALSENGAGAVDTASVSNTTTATAARYVRVKYYSGGTGSTNGKYTLKLNW
ncbi:MULTISPECIES: S8 family serine peptidase [unclassified Massilia]|uniref:S8 family serine peptidase n=1 Tax=unclassified Massilia TaxID=2609279 RepID=UPI00177E6529|nr:MULTISPECIES: S8 family serine peptidase [unclassified Massilia]MBD8532045.1 S8 family serine peptidase [Massilia sp. CFBP 13647]MBD8675491.1 S8 family serine peptidase [Massilia sp. CFBP 13721]